MKPGLFCCLFALLLVASLGLDAANSLRVSPRSLNFGESGHGEKRKLHLTLENRGKTPLRILEMKPSCGCTKIEPKIITEPLVPGGSVAVVVTMSSGRALGTLEKYIAIRTDQSRTPVRVMTRLKVHSGFEIRPRAAQFRFEGEVGGKAVRGSIDVLRRGPARGFTFSVEGIFGSRRKQRRLDKYFESRVEEISGGKRVHLALKPTHPEGRVYATLVARLDGKPFHIPVTGQMFRGLKLSPSYFNFNRVEPARGETLVEESRLIAIDGVEFAILESQVTFQRWAGADLFLQVEPKMIDGGKEYRLRATLGIRGKKRPAGSFSGKVLLRTDHPEKPEITYNFFGFFPRK